MTREIDATNDPKLTSWVESANDPATDFPIQNLPLCAFLAEHDGHAHRHLGSLIGDQVIDVSSLAMAGYFGEEGEDLPRMLHMPYWNAFAAAAEVFDAFRVRLQEFLRADTMGGQQLRRLRSKVLRPIAETPLLLPGVIFNYTDFYASIHHATTVGSMFRPENPLLPNYKHVPIGYHGRASSVVATGTPITRPDGQQSPASEGGSPTFGPSTMLDYELEVGAFIARGNRLGEPIPLANAEDHLLGLCLVNDWSARDIQKWEYQPLGPFLAKNFATSVSGCVVTMQALAPFRCPASVRPAGDPSPLAYLMDESNQARGGFDIELEVSIHSAAMRERGMSPHRVSRSRSFREMYWTIAQMVAHHTSNGCDLQAGDLIASGTVSGDRAREGRGVEGCLLELTWAGRGADGKPLPRAGIDLPTGEKRVFLEDGDEVIIRGWCEREGYRRIGFGECRGRVIPRGRIATIGD